MRVDISLLPALAAAFMLVFARVGAMVMLLPGFGESNIPVRIKLAIALLLTLIILPLHRAAYQVDLTSMTALGVLMVHEIVIGIVLGATARVTLSALPVAGSVIAQQLGLGFVTAVDPTQGQQGLLIGNFLTILGHDAAVCHRQPSSRDRGAERELPDFLAGRVAAERRRRGARHPGVRRGLQDRHAAIGAVSGVRPRLQYRPWRAGAADAGDAGLFRRRAAVDHGRLFDLRLRPHRHDGRPISTTSSA